MGDSHQRKNFPVEIFKITELPPDIIRVLGHIFGGNIIIIEVSTLQCKQRRCPERLLPWKTVTLEDCCPERLLPWKTVALEDYI
jgi:hypothetical protein